jgi:ELWxxDGT repeat protein
LVKDMRSGAANSSPVNLTVVGSQLYFTLSGDAEGSRELWKSDGSEAGTALVRDFNAGPPGPSLDTLTEAGGRLYFVASIEGVGDELWTADGTDAGTVLIQDLSTDAGGSSLWSIAVSNGRLYLGVTTREYGSEAWTADLSEPLPLAGDHDDDRRVDGADFLAWQRDFGSAVSEPGDGADASHNGVVDGFDLNLWAVNFWSDVAVEEAHPVAAPAIVAGSGERLDNSLLADAAAAWMRLHAAASPAVGMPIADEPIIAPTASPRLEAAAVDAVHGQSSPRLRRPQECEPSESFGEAEGLVVYLDAWDAAIDLTG